MHNLSTAVWGRQRGLSARASGAARASFIIPGSHKRRGESTLLPSHTAESFREEDVSPAAKDSLMLPLQVTCSSKTSA